MIRPSVILLSVIFLSVSLLPAAAQDVFDALRGDYGSASDPATSCAANPHRLDFMAEPPHALFDWTKPWTDKDGFPVSHQRYDILDHSDNTLTLRREGDTARTADGGRPLWILRQTSSPEGYCWGRADWPSVHCEDQQVRCDKATS